MSQYRIPAVSIFIASGLVSVAIAAVSGVVLYLVMFDIVESSVMREGLNQANAVGAAVRSSYEQIEQRRDELIRKFKMLHSSRDLSNTVGDDPAAMNTFLEQSFGTDFLAPASAHSIQGAEIAVLFPRGIMDNEEATGYSILSVYSEVMKDGTRTYTVKSSGADGLGANSSYIDFTAKPGVVGDDGKQLYDYGSWTVGAPYSEDPDGVAFTDNYQADYSTSDYFYFSSYAGPDGYAYFYANSYRYFYSLSDGGDDTTNPNGGYLAEVTVYQLVDTWYDLIRTTMTEGSSTDGSSSSSSASAEDGTSIILVDPMTEYILASSFDGDREKTRTCYDSVDAYFADEESCAFPTYTTSSEPLLRALVRAAVQPSWAVEGETVLARSFKQTVEGTRYYIVATQLGNQNLLRPFLIWARDADAVSKDMRRTLIIVVVVSSLGVGLASLLVAIFTALLLLRPLKRLQEHMLLLTTLDTEGIALVANLHERDAEEVEAERLYEAARNDIPTDDEMLGDSDGGDGGDAVSSVSGGIDHQNDNHNYALATTKKKKHSDDEAGRRRSPRSIIAEINSLQKNFQQMAKAVLSFGKYVPQDVVRELMATGAVAESKMVESRLTLLFSDIQGFTTLCEKLNNPAKVSRLLTLFFSKTTSRLLAHGATIDKFIGDCIMAFWGAPLRVDNANFRALCAGLDLLETARELDKVYKRHKVRLSVRVGAHCGKCMVGNIGSDERINYTAMGDVVNIASRLEGANKTYGSSFIASDEVLMGSKRSGMFAYRLVGSLTLKGKKKPTTAYHICGTRYPEVEEGGEADGGASVASPLSGGPLGGGDEGGTAGGGGGGFSSFAEGQSAVSRLGALSIQSPTTIGGGGATTATTTNGGGDGYPSTAAMSRLSGVRENILRLGDCYNAVGAYSFIRPQLIEILNRLTSAISQLESAHNVNDFSAAFMGVNNNNTYTSNVGGGGGGPFDGSASGVEHYLTNNSVSVNYGVSTPAANGAAFLMTPPPAAAATAAGGSFSPSTLGGLLAAKAAYNSTNNNTGGSTSNTTNPFHYNNTHNHNTTSTAASNHKGRNRRIDGIIIEIFGMMDAFERDCSQACDDDDYDAAEDHSNINHHAHRHAFRYPPTKRQSAATTMKGQTAAADGAIIIVNDPHFCGNNGASNVVTPAASALINGNGGAAAADAFDVGQIRKSPRNDTVALVTSDDVEMTVRDETTRSVKARSEVCSKAASSNGVSSMAHTTSNNNNKDGDHHERTLSRITAADTTTTTVVVMMDEHHTTTGAGGGGEEHNIVVYSDEEEGGPSSNNRGNAHMNSVSYERPSDEHHQQAQRKSLPPHQLQMPSMNPQPLANLTLSSPQATASICAAATAAPSTNTNTNANATKRSASHVFIMPIVARCTSYTQAVSMFIDEQSAAVAAHRQRVHDAGGSLTPPSPALHTLLFGGGGDQTTTATTAANNAIHQQQHHRHHRRLSLRQERLSVRGEDVATVTLPFAPAIMSPAESAVMNSIIKDLYRRAAMADE